MDQIPKTGSGMDGFGDWIRRLESSGPKPRHRDARKHEGLNAAGQLWAGIEYVWDRAPLIFWTWLIIAGLVSAMTGNMTLFTWAFVAPITLLTGSAIILVACLCIRRLLRFMM